MDDHKRNISPSSAEEDPKDPRLMAPLANNADRSVIQATAPTFKSGDIPNTLRFMVVAEQEENVHHSMFAGLDWTLAKCRTLVSNHPALERAVRDCFEREILDPLREYISGMERSKTDQTGAPGTFPRSGGNDVEVTQHAWRMEYKGGAADCFVQALHNMNTDRERHIYDNFVPIVQSSGTGKSRMGDEAAKYIFTIPFNIRSSRDTSGYPYSDAQVHDFLVGVVANRSSKDVQSFTGQWVTQIRIRLGHS